MHYIVYMHFRHSGSRCFLAWDRSSQVKEIEIHENKTYKVIHKYKYSKTVDWGGDWVQSGELGGGSPTLEQILVLYEANKATLRLLFSFQVPHHVLQKIHPKFFLAPA